MDGQAGIHLKTCDLKIDASRAGWRLPGCSPVLGEWGFIFDRKKTLVVNHNGHSQSPETAVTRSKSNTQ
ncbi:MAG TPA: hypothetical protein DEF45_16120 [Rhodopirellula sp.]|nr:hypothetical protein [Rhodopirellula sp.]